MALRRSKKRGSVAAVVRLGQLAEFRAGKADKQATFYTRAGIDARPWLMGIEHPDEVVYITVACSLPFSINPPVLCILCAT